MFQKGIRRKPSSWVVHLSALVGNWFSRSDSKLDYSFKHMILTLAHCSSKCIGQQQYFAILLGPELSILPSCFHKWPVLLTSISSSRRQVFRGLPIFNCEGISSSSRFSLTIHYASQPASLELPWVLPLEYHLRPLPCHSSAVWWPSWFLTWWACRNQLASLHLLRGCPVTMVFFLKAGLLRSSSKCSAHFLSWLSAQIKTLPFLSLIGRSVHPNLPVSFLWCHNKHNVHTCLRFLCFLGHSIHNVPLICSNASL